MCVACSSRRVLIGWLGLRHKVWTWCVSWLAICITKRMVLGTFVDLYGGCESLVYRFSLMGSAAMGMCLYSPCLYMYVCI